MIGRAIAVPTLAGLLTGSALSSVSVPVATNGATVNWPADEAIYSQLGSITSANVARLGLVASLDLPGAVDGKPSNNDGGGPS